MKKQFFKKFHIEEHIKESTPTAAVRKLLDVQTLHLDIRLVADKTTYSLKCCGEYQGNGLEYLTIQDMMLRHNIFTATQVRTNRTLQS